VSGRLPWLRTAVVLAVAVLGGAAAPAAAEGTGALATVLDNAHAGSVLEVGRTANLQAGSGTAGSDHDGGAVDVREALVGAARGGAEDGG
jgi:hypothetical protein